MTKYSRRWLQTKQKNSVGLQSNASRRQGFTLTSDAPLTESTKLEQHGQKPTKESDHDL